MNLIEESFQKKEEKKRKKAAGIVLGAIIFVILVIIAIVCYLAYKQSTTMKFFLNGSVNENLRQIIKFDENGEIYASIRDISTYLGYETFNGSYTQRSEDISKCYVQSENEVADLMLHSNTIYKLDLTTGTDNYEYVYIEDPIFAREGILYATAETLEKAFNVSIQYDKSRNRIDIYTLPYLVEVYSKRVLDYNYNAISGVFSNQKAILQDMLVVTKGEGSGSYAVIDLEGNTILEPKYDNITYLPSIGDFKIQSNNKVGIMGNKGETKIQIMYNSIELMDSNAGLYVASNNNKYGVIDTRGNIKIYIENDEIGMDISPFEQNDIKNKYILAGNLIPAKRNNLWGLYDKNGNLVVDFKYDSFGYIARTNRDAMNLLVIPDYEVLVACIDRKYTLLNSEGQELFGAPIADDIYMTITGGQTHYYITANNQTIDAETYLDNISVRKQSEGGNTTNIQNTNNTQNNNEQGNQTTNNNQPEEGNGQTTEVNNEQPIENNGEEVQQPAENGEQPITPQGNF